MVDAAEYNRICEELSRMTSHYEDATDLIQKMMKQKDALKADIERMSLDKLYAENDLAELRLLHEATVIEIGKLCGEDLSDEPRSKWAHLAVYNKITGLTGVLESVKRRLVEIAGWNSHSTEFSVNYGSSGVRDFYRSIARIYECGSCGCRLETGEEFNHGKRWNERTESDTANLVTMQGQLNLITSLNVILRDAIQLYLKTHDTEGFGCACTPERKCGPCREWERQKPLRDALSLTDLSGKSAENGC